MAINEQIVTGRAHRTLIDKETKLWQRKSFWTKSSDVEFNDGKTAETKVGAIKGITTDTNVTETGYAADATAVAQLYSDLGGFEPVLDSTGEIIGYKTTVGADTVFPFNSEDRCRQKLYVAIQNSGLVTASMTFDQMLAALSKRFPVGREFITNISTSYQNLGGHNSYADETKAQLNGSAVTAIMSNYGWSTSTGYRQTVNTNSVDLTNYDKLVLKGNVSTVQGNASAPTSAVYLCNSSGTVVYTFRSGAGVGAINSTIDLTNYKGLHFIKIVQEEWGCKITSTITSAYLS